MSKVECICGMDRDTCIDCIQDEVDRLHPLCDRYEKALRKALERVLSLKSAGYGEETDLIIGEIINITNKALNHKEGA